MSISRDHRGRQRRPSTRQSISFSPSFRSQSTPLAQDLPTRGIYFKLEHVHSFYMLRELWETLPNKLRPDVVNMQHFGAAVITAIDRLETQRHSLLDGNVIEDGAYHADPEGQSIASPDHKGLGLGMSLGVLRTPSLTSVCSLSVSAVSSRRNSNAPWFEAAGRDPRIVDAFGSLNPTTPGTPMSPLELSPKASSPMFSVTPARLFRSQSDSLGDLAHRELLPAPLPRRVTLATAASLTNEVASSPPALDAKIYKWRVQLEELRTNWLVELRHGQRKIETEWNILVAAEESQAACYRHNPSEFLSHTAAAPTSIKAPTEWSNLKGMMQEWLIDMKRLADELIEKTNSFEGGVTLGWSAIALSKRR